MKNLPLILIGIFVVFALSVSIITPAFESQDEEAHFHFIQYLWLYKTLPIVEFQIIPGIQENHQPPLYYLAVLITTSPSLKDLSSFDAAILNPSFTSDFNSINGGNKNRFLHTKSDDFPFIGSIRVLHFSRLGSVAFAVANAIVLWLLSKYLFQTFEQRSAFLACSLFLPGYIFISGMVNNDNAVALGGSLILLLCISLLDSPDSTHNWIMLGSSFSIAMLSKFNAVVLALPITLTVLLIIARAPVRRKIFLNASLAFIIVFALTSWWFIRNIILYGVILPFGRYNAMYGEGENFSTQQAYASLTWLWETFWGRFGVGAISMPTIFYILFGIMTVISLTGIFFSLLQRDFDRQWVVLLSSVMAMLAAVFYNSGIITVGAQGRYLYPVLGAVMAIVVKGLLTLTPTRFHKALTYSLITVMPILSAVAIFVWLPAAYKLPTRYNTFTPPANFQPLNYNIGESIKLHGITVSSSRLAPSDTLTVTLYWEALKPIEANHVVFLQVIDNQSNKVAQRQTISGLGMYQPTRWKVGEVIADAIPLTIDADATAPREYVIIGGMLDEKSGERLPMTRSDYKLGEVMLVPRQMLNALPQASHPLTAQFDQGIRLQGCVLKESVLTLYWQASQRVNQNYKVFVHLWDINDQFLTGLDHTPMQERFPTRHWLVGDWIPDEVALPDRARVARITVGLYAEGTQQRLPLIAPPQSEHSFALPDKCWK